MERTDDELEEHNESDESVELESSRDDNGEQIEYLDGSNDESQLVITSSVVSQLGKIMTKAIETQTKTITQAIQSQTNMIEKLLTAERERLEIIMAAERENRRQLEARLDKILNKLESSAVPQLMYMENVIES